MNTPTEHYSWAELAAIALHRQFPAADSVAELVEQVGPIQSQAARAPFLGIAARLTSADHASITAAYEQAAIVRGSTLRGTVHTSTAAVHPILDVLTRLGVGGRWTQLIASNAAPRKSCGAASRNTPPPAGAPRTNCATTWPAG